MQWKKAGSRNASAKIHASGLAKHAGRNPNTGTRQNPTRDLAAISQTPARIANVEKPIPWMVKADDVDKGQRDIEHAVSSQEHGYPADDLGLVCVHEEERNVFAAKEQDNECDQGINDSDQACSLQSFFYAV